MTSYEPFSATAAGTTSATATKYKEAGARLVVTHVSGHTDASSIIRLDDEDGNVLWETSHDGTSVGPGFCLSIPDGVPTPPNKNVLGMLITGTADCQINISGYIRPE